MIVTSEDIMAYVDGEADQATVERVEAAARFDPAIARQIAAERELSGMLRGFSAKALDEPVPSAWADMIRAAVTTEKQAPSAIVTDLADARARRQGVKRPVWRSAWIGGAMAASLVLGLFIGTQRQAGLPIESTDGALLAQASLARSLDTQLASAPEPTPIRMLATFRSLDGSICRAFAGAEASGIACRSGDDWQVRHLLPGRGPETMEYRQAGAGDGELMALAQQMVKGEPFDAQAEAEAKSRGWR